MRVAALFGMVTAVLIALANAPLAVGAAYIVPEWAKAGDDPARHAMLLSDAKTLE